MISLRKLASLSEATRRRKLVSLLKDFENAAVRGESIDKRYLMSLLEMVKLDAFWPQSLLNITAAACGELQAAENLLQAGPLRSLNSVRHGMLKALGTDVADWDMASPRDSETAAETPAFPMRVFLENLRSPFNVGSIFRTALAFGFEKIWISPECADPNHARSKRSSMGSVDRMSWERKLLQNLKPADTGTLFALEIGGTELSSFSFPETGGTVILGSEELGISPELLKIAESDGGITSIPLPGSKASLNVGVAFGILAECWIGRSAGSKLG